YFMVLAGIVACGGSGENNGGGRNIQPETVTTLSPLKISILDLNNNPIPYVDISKIGSHTLYKLKFININSVAINLSNVVIRQIIIMLHWHNLWGHQRKVILLI